MPNGTLPSPDESLRCSFMHTNNSFIIAILIQMDYSSTMQTLPPRRCGENGEKIASRQKKSREKKELMPKRVKKADEIKKRLGAIYIFVSIFTPARVGPIMHTLAHATSDIFDGQLSARPRNHRTTFQGEIDTAWSGNTTDIGSASNCTRCSQ